MSIKNYIYVVRTSNEMDERRFDFEEEALDYAKFLAEDGKEATIEGIEVELDQFGNVLSAEASEILHTGVFRNDAPEESDKDTVVFALHDDDLNDEEDDELELYDEHPLDESQDDNQDIKNRLLGRLLSDCRYFLGAGNRYEGNLWAGNITDQIAKMRELYDELEVKPDWISLEEIDALEDAMIEDNNAAEEIQELMEEIEDEVECRVCCETFSKSDCFKRPEGGYVCSKCVKTLQDHCSGANIDTSAYEEQLNEAVDVKVGDTIKILSMPWEPEYIGRVGVVERIDDGGLLQGTWGELAVIIGADKFIVIEKAPELQENTKN